jgi:hypothetical protein
VDLEKYAAKHFKTGWYLLFVFVCLGATLEALHGFKVSWYLDISNETRRFLFRLAHAHGTLLAIINIVFAVSLKNFRNIGKRVELISLGLLLSSILLPAGFLLGGLSIYGNDPGLGIALAVAGAAIFVVTLMLAAISA